MFCWSSSHAQLHSNSVCSIPSVNRSSAVISCLTISSKQSSAKFMLGGCLGKTSQVNLAGII